MWSYVQHMIMDSLCDTELDSEWPGKIMCWEINQYMYSSTRDIRLFIALCHCGTILMIRRETCLHGSVMGVLKTGNNVPRVGIETTSLAFWASVLQLHHVSSLMSPLYPRPPVYVALCLRDHCRLLQLHSPIKSSHFLTRVVRVGQVPAIKDHLHNVLSHVKSFVRITDWFDEF